MQTRFPMTPYRIVTEGNIAKYYLDSTETLQIQIKHCNVHNWSYWSKRKGGESIIRQRWEHNLMAARHKYRYIEKWESNKSKLNNLHCTERGSKTQKSSISNLILFRSTFEIKRKKLLASSISHLVSKIFWFLKNANEIHVPYDVIYSLIP